jgi:hypothetical protein
MSYVGPVIAPSGTTFAQFQAGGLSNQIEKLITANTTATTAPSSAATISVTGGGQTIAVPTVQATVAVGSATTGSLPAGTYYVGYTWVTPTGETTMGAGSPAASVSAQFTESGGKTPVVTIPSLPAGVSYANIYLSATNGSNTALYLYATGVTGTTFTLNSSYWMNQATASNSTSPPASNGTTGGLAAGTYYIGYTWVHAHGETTMGAGSPAASVSAQLTVAAGNVPQVTIPSLPTGAVSANIYVSNTNGSSSALVLYAKGVTTTTYNLYSSTWNGVAFASGTSPPASNTTAGSLAATSYYLNFTETNGFGETTASTESSQFTVSAGNIPRLTFPALQTGNTARNVYLTSGASGTETLYATGVSSLTFDLVNAVPASGSGGTWSSQSAPTANSTGLTYTDANNNVHNKVLEYLRLFKDMRGDRVFLDVSELLRQWNRGEPIGAMAITEKLHHAHVTFAMLGQACTEIGTLIDANPGTFKIVSTGIGNSRTVRGWP